MLPSNSGGLAAVTLKNGSCETAVVVAVRVA